jgi:CRP-like cAMP-binding protein
MERKPKGSRMNTIDSRFDTNQLLASLSSEERQHLESDLEWVDLPAGTVLHSSGTPLRQVHFPATATVSLVSSMADGATAEVAVVGSEGMVGICAFMGNANALSDAVVQRPGHAWRMSTAAVQHHTQRSPDFMQQLLGYTQALFTHMAQCSACNRHHALDQQLCRWLLQHLDRQEGSDMQITQERIASLLGVRREGVTWGALKLQKAGLIDYHRGHISIIDRSGLEARSCECYGVVRQAYDNLSGAHGISRRTSAEAQPGHTHRAALQRSSADARPLA